MAQPSAKVKLGRRVAVLEQFCEKLAQQVTSVHVALRNGGSGAGSGAGRHKTSLSAVGMGTPASLTLSSVLTAGGKGSDGDVVATVRSNTRSTTTAVASACSPCACRACVALLPQRLSPLLAEALAGDVRRNVLASVDRRFVDLEGLKDMSFQDVWKELRALHGMVEQGQSDAKLALKELELAQKSELLNTTRATEEQLDAVQNGVAQAVQQHMQETANVVAVTNGRISDVHDELAAAIAQLRGGDGRCERRGHTDLGSWVEAVADAGAATQTQLNDHARTASDAFQDVQRAQSTLRKDVDDVDGKCADNRAAVEASAATLATVQRRLDALTQSVQQGSTGATAEVAELRARLARQEELMTSLSMSVRNTEQSHAAKLAQLADSAASAAASITTATQKLAAHGLELGRVGEQVIRVELAASQLRGEHADTAKTLSRVADEVSALAQELRQTSERAATNASACNTLTRRVTAQSNTVDRLRNEVLASARQVASRRGTGGNGGNGGAGSDGGAGGGDSGGRGAPSTSQLDRRVAELAGDVDAVRKMVAQSAVEVRARLEATNADVTAALARQQKDLLRRVDDTLQQWSDTRASLLAAQIRASQLRKQDMAHTPRSTGGGGSAGGGSSPGGLRSGGNTRSNGSHGGSSGRGGTADTRSHASVSSRHSSRGQGNGGVGGSGGSAGHNDAGRGHTSRGSVHSSPPRRHAAAQHNTGSTGGGGGGGGGDPGHSVAASTVSGAGSLNDGNPMSGSARGGRASKGGRFQAPYPQQLAHSIVSGADSSVVGREMLPPSQRHLVVSSPLPDVAVGRLSLTSFLMREGVKHGDKIAFMSAPSQQVCTATAAVGMVQWNHTSSFGDAVLLPRDTAGVAAVLTRGHGIRARRSQNLRRPGCAGRLADLPRLLVPGEEGRRRPHAWRVQEGRCHGAVRTQRCPVPRRLPRRGCAWGSARTVPCVGAGVVTVGAADAGAPACHRHHADVLPCVVMLRRVLVLPGSSRHGRALTAAVAAAVASAAVQAAQAMSSVRSDVLFMRDDPAAADDDSMPGPPSLDRLMAGGTAAFPENVRRSRSLSLLLPSLLLC